MPGNRPTPHDDGHAVAERRLGERIDALEARLSYQDLTIETLNSTITEQWKQIDRLTRQIALLGERLQDAENRTGAPSNEPPPHY